MNPQEKAAQFIDALHALEEDGGDTADSKVSALVELYAPDAFLTNAALKLAGDERTGADAIRQFWTEYKKSLGRCHSQFHHVTSDETSAGLFWTTKGDGPQGQGIEYDGVSLLEYDEAGLIRSFRGYYDTRELTVRATTNQ